MWRYLVGGFAALFLVAAGVLFFKTPARSIAPLRAPPPAAQTTEPEPMPDSVPEATPKTREQKRFNR